MAIYNYVQFSVAKQQLANRLFDSAMTFWSSTEIGLYIAEALRTWNALTSYWRSDFLFNAQQNVTWYDLTDSTNLPNSFRLLTLKDADLYTVIQYHLLEPAVGVNPWTGVSQQFTADDLINAVTRRRDEVLSVCGCTLTRRLVGAVAGRIALPDTVIDVRRMAYLPDSPGVNSVVWADDTWAEQAFNRNYTILPAGTPSTYLLSAQPPISFDVDRPPAYAGQYELLTVEAGAALSASTPSALSVPDDWTHIIKWGALADLFSRESNAKDALRAGYCEQRYRMGLALLSNAAALLAMRIGNVPLQMDSVRAADLYRTSWQAEAAKNPNIALTAGLNLVALAPVPDAGPYSLTATVVQNAPVPVNATDPVQVARDDLDVLLDYSVHLAMLKCGGAEFIATMPLFERFLKQAATYGLKLAQLGEYTSVLFGQSQRQAQMDPVLAVAPAGGA